MLFCVNCQCEYRDGFTVCSDCGAVLTDALPVMEDETEPADIPAFLCSIDDGIKAEMVIALLKSQGIPVMKQRREAGEYLNIYMGVSVFGADLYVPSKLHEEANEILKAQPVMDQEDIEDEQFSEIVKKETVKRQRKMRGVVLVCFVAPILIVYLSLLISRLLT